MGNTPQQLTLNLGINNRLTFENFFPAANEPLLKFLHDFLKLPQEQFCYLWGAPGSGRSHLLQACCNAIISKNRSAIYIPCAEIGSELPHILENIANIELICLDDIEAITAEPAAAEALFHAFNQVLAAGTKMIFASNSSPLNLFSPLPDLQSRLASAVVFQLRHLSDRDLIAALSYCANLRGLELSPQVGSYLLNHYSRSPQELFTALDHLDRAALAAQRKLTIPFLKQCRLFELRIPQQEHNIS